MLDVPHVQRRRRRTGWSLAAMIGPSRINRSLMNSRAHYESTQQQRAQPTTKVTAAGMQMAPGTRFWCVLGGIPDNAIANISTSGEATSARCADDISMIGFVTTRLRIETLATRARPTSTRPHNLGQTRGICRHQLATRGQARSPPRSPCASAQGLPTSRLRRWLATPTTPRTRGGKD